jgi:spore coat polysaccharide biosynthesis protein SpsF (cytidylyltransferase family)
MSGPRVVAVIQARMGSTRLPGKVLSEIEGQPLLAWTVRGVQAIPGVSDVVVATTTEPSDDPVVALAGDLGVPTHRGSVHDVLARCHAAVAPFGPEVVVRQTADNPFPDPNVAAAQVRSLVEGGLDYVGIAGWPLGIAAEACRMTALDAADREATDAADREHVTPFVYRQPDRFRIGRLPRSGQGIPAAGGARYTVDTADDLAFARAIAARLGHEPPVVLGELEAILGEEPGLLVLNAAVEQRSWRDAQPREAGRWTS